MESNQNGSDQAGHERSGGTPKSVAGVVSPQKSHRAVLVVEDDDLLRNLIIRTLGNAGFEVEGAATGSAAIDHVRRFPGWVLLLDQQLPDMTGQEVVSVLASSGVKVHFVVMTGQGDERLAVDMMKFGAADYLIKDAGLVDVLPSVLDRTFRSIESERLLQTTELALRESENRFRKLFQDMTAVAVHGYGRTGVIHYWNRASTLLYGYSSQEAIGANILDLLVPGELREAIEISMRQMVEAGVVTPPSESVFRCKDGSLVDVYSAHSIVRLPGHEPELFCISVDLTDRKRAEEEREKLREQLSQSQKMESVSRLAGGVAHDFNNMLGVIFGHAELAMDMITPQDPMHACLKEIHKAAERSAELTRQLLAFARKQTVQPRVVDINVTLGGMLQMLKRVMQEQIELVWKPGHDIGKVRIDPLQLHQILVNLCLNAREAISDTGTVTLRTDSIVIDDAFCVVHEGAVPGRYALIEVSDSGCGMDAEAQRNLFEPFYSTGASGEGIGLGLSSVYGAIKQNNGYIDVSSKPGAGSVFSIYLPLHEEAQGSAAPAAGGARQPDCVETILLVEDEVAILRMIRNVLARQGYSVMATSVPYEAIDMARSHSGKIDLLISDVIMPGMNGKDLSEKIIQLCPGIKCLFMSGYTANVIAPHGMLEDSVKFIQKPFLISDLTTMVRDVLRGEPDPFV